MGYIARRMADPFLRIKQPSNIFDRHGSRLFRAFCSRRHVATSVFAKAEDSPKGIFQSCFIAPCDAPVMAGNPDGIWMQLSCILACGHMNPRQLAGASMRMVGPQGPGCFAQVLAQQGISRRHGDQRCKKHQARDQQILFNDSQHIKTLSGAVLRKGLNTELIAQPIFICWFSPTGSSLASSLWRGQVLVTMAPRRDLSVFHWKTPAARQIFRVGFLR